MKRMRACAFLGGVLLILGGCNQPPVIEWVEKPAWVYAFQKATFSVEASDPEGEGICSCDWYALSGTFTAIQDNEIEWTAPRVSGECTVGVNVEDAAGKTENLETEVKVRPLTTNIISDDFTIGLRDYAYVIEEIGGSYTVSGTFNVADGVIDFYVMDSVNFAKWTRSETAYGYVSFQDSGATSFSFKTPQVGTYYFVMVNYDFYEARRVHLRVDKTTP